MNTATDYGRQRAAGCAALVGPARLSISIYGLEVMRVPIWMLFALETMRFQTPGRIANRLKPGMMFDCTLTLSDGQRVKWQEAMPDMDDGDEEGGL